MDDALAPLPVGHAAADLERHLLGRGVIRAALEAVVAVAARRLERLAEVREHERAPAAVRLGVAAHHAHARALEAAALLLGLRGGADRLARLGRPVGRSHLAARED